MDFETRRLDSWEKIVPSFKYDKEVPFFEMLVPTIDTVRFGYLLEKLLSVRYSVLYTGGTGVGKVGTFVLSKTIKKILIVHNINHLDVPGKTNN